ncbi:MAG: hypothetical protein AAF502_23670 [Bacteroidota bacterium]
MKKVAISIAVIFSAFFFINAQMVTSETNAAPISENGNHKWSIQFIRIDNKVKIYQNGAVVYESQFVDSNPILNEVVVLNNVIYDDNGEATIYVKIYNPPYKDYNPWEVHYNIFKDDVHYGTVHQYGDGINYTPTSYNKGKYKMENGLMVMHTSKHELY